MKELNEISALKIWKIRCLLLACFSVFVVVSCIVYSHNLEVSLSEFNDTLTYLQDSNSSYVQFIEDDYCFCKALGYDTVSTSVRGSYCSWFDNVEDSVEELRVFP